MSDSEHHQPATRFDACVHFRAPSNLMPADHSNARRRGLTSALWLRMVILAALGRPVPQQEAV